MRALLVDEGNDADFAACEKHGIDSLYFALRDPRVTRAYLLDVRAKGYQVGVYAAWNWPGWGSTGKEFAEAVSEAVEALRAPGDPVSFPRVQLNDETHDAARITALLTRWRELHRYQATSWTFEGMQGGWMTPEFVAAVVKARARLAPQAYNGAMTELWDPLAVARDLTARGFESAIVSPMYDAAGLQHYWQGFAFTAGRLPA